jgi:hypothetical protein
MWTQTTVPQGCKSGGQLKNNRWSVFFKTSVPQDIKIMFGAAHGALMLLIIDIAHCELSSHGASHETSCCNDAWAMEQENGDR